MNKRKVTVSSLNAPAEYNFRTAELTREAILEVVQTAQDLGLVTISMVALEALKVEGLRKDLARAQTLIMNMNTRAYKKARIRRAAEK